MITATTSTPFISIISPDYEGSVSEHRRLCFLESVIRQSFPLWELLLIHDGPRSRSISINDSRIKVINTEQRANDWGHSNRHMGIGLAQGQYIFHCNPDNYLYEHCLAILHAYSLHAHRSIRYQVGPSAPPQAFHENPDVLIFAVRMMGVVNPGKMPSQLRLPGRELTSQLLLPGWPPKPGAIDAMQLVAKKEIWSALGGWQDKSEGSDGKIYEKICSINGYKVIPEVLGEHW